MEKLIITAAICGAEVTKKNNANVPYTVAEIAAEAYRAYNAGASIIHLHVREDDGTPTQDISRFKSCIDAIRSKCPEVIIQPSTGGAVGMSNAERLQPILLKPEMASLDCGTCNFGGDDIFINTENTIKDFAEKFKELNIKPEIGVFDIGMITTALRLKKSGYFPGKMHFNLAMGVNGAIAATLFNLGVMVQSLPADATFTVTGIGRHQFTMAAMAIAAGGHVRVGFEDNVYLRKGAPAQSNGELVAQAARIAREIGREIANPQEARSILGLAGI